jgi:hypothetical protein
LVKAELEDADARILKHQAWLEEALRGDRGLRDGDAADAEVPASFRGGLFPVALERARTV